MNPGDMLPQMPMESASAEVAMALHSARHVHRRIAEAVFEYIANLPPETEATAEDVIKALTDVVAKSISPIGLPAMARQIDTETGIETGEGLHSMTDIHADKPLP